LCVQCDSATGRCEEDQMTVDSIDGPLCEECYHATQNVSNQRAGGKGASTGKTLNHRLRCIGLLSCHTLFSVVARRRIVQSILRVWTRGTCGIGKKWRASDVVYAACGLALHRNVSPRYSVYAS
jgi:hypothetical protein